MIYSKTEREGKDSSGNCLLWTSLCEEVNESIREGYTQEEIKKTCIVPESLKKK